MHRPGRLCSCPARGRRDDDDSCRGGRRRGRVHGHGFARPVREGQGAGFPQDGRARARRRGLHGLRARRSGRRHAQPAHPHHRRTRRTGSVHALHRGYDRRRPDDQSAAGMVGPADRLRRGRGADPPRGSRAPVPPGRRHRSCGHVPPGGACRTRARDRCRSQRLRRPGGRGRRRARRGRSGPRGHGPPDRARPQAHRARHGRLPGRHRRWTAPHGLRAGAHRGRPRGR